MGGCTPRGCTQFLEWSKDPLQINKRNISIHLFCIINVLIMKMKAYVSVRLTKVQESSFDGRQAVPELRHLFLFISQQKDLFESSDRVVVSCVVDEGLFMEASNLFDIIVNPGKYTFSFEPIYSVFLKSTLTNDAFQVFSVEAFIMCLPFLSHLEQFIDISSQLVSPDHLGVSDHRLRLDGRNLLLAERIAPEKLLDERRIGDAFKLYVLNLVRDEDWWLVAHNQLQKIANKLVVGLVTVLMCKTHLFMFSHLVLQVNIYQSYLLSKRAGPPEAGKIQIPQPHFQLMELCHYLHDFEEYRHDSPAGHFFLLVFCCLYDLVYISTGAVFIKDHDTALFILVSLQSKHFLVHLQTFLIDLIEVDKSEHLRRAIDYVGEVLRAFHFAAKVESALDSISGQQLINGHFLVLRLHLLYLPGLLLNGETIGRNLG